MKFSKQKTNNGMAFLQPEVPHYREEFFEKIATKCKCCDIFIYNTEKEAKKQGFNVVSKGVRYIPNIQVHGLMICSPLPLLSKKYDTLVLMLHFGHITTWLLLLTKWLHRKRIILWGQGISVKRYLREEQCPDWKLKWQIALADGIWIYTKKEVKIWKKLFPRKPIVALGNTLSGIDDMIHYVPTYSKTDLKNKYNITENIILIFCARFNHYRRVDLLLKTIHSLDSSKYGFVIIGAGETKPDFSIFANVYDFGALYDTAIKQELFTIADLYFQPGWVGLSIVEAMAYGIPICTFQRTEDTKQCVEYSYIIDNVNGLLFSDIDDCINKITSLSKEDMQRMGRNARQFVIQHLSPSKMVERAWSIL